MTRQIQRRLIDDVRQPGPTGLSIHDSKLMPAAKLHDPEQTDQKRSNISVASTAVRGALNSMRSEEIEAIQFKKPKAETKQLQIDENLLIEVGDALYSPSPAKLRKHQKIGTVSEHLHELQIRAMYSVAALLVGSVIGYKLQKQIIAWMVKPLGKQLFYTSPTGGFDFLIKICMFFGFVVAVPVIVYNLLQFIAPVVPQHVTRKTGQILITSSLLALMGLLFAYYVSLPAALHFLNAFSTGPIQSLITAQEYFNFVIIYLGGFAALFQMPLIFSFVNKITPLKPAKLFDKQRIVILISFIVAAILTPTPDPINQTLMALPIIALYQASIIVVWQQNKHRSQKPVSKATLDLVMDY